MNEKKDYYKILEVAEKATQDEIKKSYRTMSKDNHPDLHPGDSVKESKFKDIAEAYGILGDVEKRTKYDQGDPNPYAHMFQQSRRNPEDIVNLQISIPVSLDDYISGNTIEVTYQRHSTEGSVSQKCPSCNGQGYETMMFGGGMVKMTCNTCIGKGVYTPLSVKTNTIKLQLIYGNLNYLISGQGSVIQGNRYGSVQIVISLQSSALYSYDEETGNIIHSMKINLNDYLNGCDVIVPHHIKALKITHINNGESVRKYRLVSKGIKVTSNVMTDLIVSITPKLPVTLNDVEKNLIEALSLSENFNVQRQIP